MNARAVTFSMAVAVAAAAAALLPACEREPDALLYVIGRVTDETGAPLRDARVELLRNGNNVCTGDFYGYSPVDGGTYDVFSTFESNERGDFLFELLQRDVTGDDLSEYRSPACFHVRVERDGQRSEFSFPHPGGDVELTDLPVRTANAAVSVEGGVVSLGTPRAVPLEGFEASLAGWEIHSGDALAWSQLDAPDAGVTTLPPEALEDFAAPTARHRTVALYAREPPPLLPTAYFVYLMDVVGRTEALPAGAQTPLSRGAPCEPGSADGGSCELTDGQLVSVSFVSESPTPETPPVPPPQEIRIDLVEPKAVSRLIVRDLVPNGPAEEIWIEASVDGETWTKVGSLGGVGHATTPEEWHRDTLQRRRAMGLYVSVPLEVSPPVRYVRIVGREAPYPSDPGNGGPAPIPPPGPTLFISAREISIF